MNEKLIVRNSLGEIIREDNKHEYDSVIDESIYILNVISDIKDINISKELGLILRNVNEKEINYILPKISNQIEKAMKLGFEKISVCEHIYDENSGETTNIKNFFTVLNDKINFDEAIDIQLYIYSKLISEQNKLNEKLIYSKEEDFSNIKEYSNKLAKIICSKFIVLEVKDYNKLYSIFNKYYFLNNDVVRMNWCTRKFIYNLVKFLNVIFLMNDSHIDETNCNFNIIEFEQFSFHIYSFVSFYDGYYHNFYSDRNISQNLNKIDSNYIDSYIINNKQNLNNLLFIVSKMYVEDDKTHEFNYREYNLNLISILELLLVNSNDEKNIKNKFIKNILICLAINNSIKNLNEEKSILNSIYNYRSCILHGNYPGYTNAMSDLEKFLKYMPKDYELTKYNTIDYLISKKLNYYVSNVFRVISINKNIIDIIKS